MSKPITKDQLKFFKERQPQRFLITGSTLNRKARRKLKKNIKK